MLQPVGDSKFQEICLYFIYLPVFIFFMQSKSIIYFFHLLSATVHKYQPLNICSIIKFVDILKFVFFYD